MNIRAFNNYILEIFNGIDAAGNHHDEKSDKVFFNNGRWALNSLEKIFDDRDKNINRWLNNKPCVFKSDKTNQKVEVNIGRDIEALYYFLIFCKRINNEQEISEELGSYVALLISKSLFPGWEEC